METGVHPDGMSTSKNLTRPVKGQILKKFEHMKQPLQARGLHSPIFQVEEIGQHRISFKIDGQDRIKKINFVGNHKQYEKWYKEE